MKHIVYSLLLLAALSCNSSIKDGYIPIIDLGKDLQIGYEVPLSSIASSVEYIPLETAPASYIFVCGIS